MIRTIFNLKVLVEYVRFFNQIKQYTTKTKTELCKKFKEFRNLLDKVRFEGNYLKQETSQYQTVEFRQLLKFN